MTDRPIEHHPMQPPSKLVKQWVHEVYSSQSHIDTCDIKFARLAYTAGADAQLDADRKWLADSENNNLRRDICYSLSYNLYSAMRPKPPTLKEQAFEALDCIEADFNTVGDRVATIRKALEQLND